MHGYTAGEKSAGADVGIRAGTVENMVGQRGKVMKEFLSFYKGKKVLSKEDK